MAEQYVMVVYGTAITLWAEPKYLESYDIEYEDGRGRCSFTTDLDKAKKFASGEEVFEAWRTQSKAHPIRKTDGKPNRPLTAYSIQVQSVTAARAEGLKPFFGGA